MNDVIEMRRLLPCCQPVSGVGDSHKILVSVDQLEGLQWQEVHGGATAVAEVHLVVDEEHVGQVGQGELGSDVVALLAGEDVGLVGGDGPVSVLVTEQHFQTGGTNEG